MSILEFLKELYENFALYSVIFMMITFANFYTYYLYVIEPLLVVLVAEMLTWPLRFEKFLIYVYDVIGPVQIVATLLCTAFVIYFHMHMKINREAYQEMGLYKRYRRLEIFTKIVWTIIMLLHIDILFF